ncbi:MAG: GerW family sporulation protein [Lachnospiraceae bacterium]|nr:GerW family sporulation protein [Lachnospiraceae bacterium]
MENKNQVFNDTVNTLFQGMDGFVSTKTVVGDAIHIGDTIIVPLVNVTFGVAAGAFRGEKKLNSGGGLGGKMTPSAVLVIHNGVTRMISVDSHSGIEKILDMIPDFVEKFSSNKKRQEQDPDARERAAEEMEEMLSEAVNQQE